MDGLSTPVVLIVFNRPDLTRATLDAIRVVAPTQLIVLADGPRPARPDDVDKCARTRAVIDEVDWPCDVHRRFQAGNLGCEASVELGLDWVFDHVDRAIIVEDDCVPDPTFFRFATMLLEHYARDEQVMMVSGNSMHVPSELFAGDSYALTGFASVWGWATWSRAWRRHREDFPRTHSGTENRPGTVPPERCSPARMSRQLVTGGGRRYFEEVSANPDGNAFSWDSHWWVSLLSMDALAVTPATNLVQNRGFGEDATYTKSGKIGEAAATMQFPLRHPAQREVNVAVQRELEIVLVRANGPLARRARALLGESRLWAVARRAATHPATGHVVRSVLAARARFTRSVATRNARRSGS